MKTARCRSLILLELGPAVLLAAVFCSAQNPTDAIPSLGDLAHRAQAERARRVSSPTRVYTNDDFPLVASPGPEIQKSAPESTDQQFESPRGSTAVTKDQATRNGDEGYYRTTMHRLRSKLEVDQKTLKDTLTYRWDPTGFYVGLEPPNDKFINNALLYWDEILAYQKFKATKASVAADEEAIAGLEEQCRRAACSPEWLR
jgi:hypothetical protein